jgi:hypothetical protein
MQINISCLIAQKLELYKDFPSSSSDLEIEFTPDEDEDEDDRSNGEQDIHVRCEVSEELALDWNTSGMNFSI